ncbi:MAG: alpha/beta hydrolase [Fuerstiella sp.]|nr:alpha/beta hydrolase [Fuerstiella sp.]
MTAHVDRRQIVKNAALGFVMVTLSQNVLASEVQTKLTTYTYKQVDNLKIRADVHRADDNTLRPVIVWIHGGALINGSRAGVSGRVKKRMLEAGYIIVSIDYRLAPETKLPGIIEDIEDAFRWIRKDGAALFHADTGRIAVMGGSAGGCLTLTSGFRVQPRPTVLVAFWGYGDLVGDWYSKPSPHPRHNRVQVTKEDAFAQVTGPPVSDARKRKGNGGTFYNGCRQRGIWPQQVTNWNPITEAQNFYPYMAVKNVTRDYPPTMLIHGTNDTDVPYEQSTMMAEEFRKHGVEHELISIVNGEHGLVGGDPQLIDRAYVKAFEFVDRHMK